MCPQASPRMLTIKEIQDGLTFEHQDDAYLSQDDPVSLTYYEVLPTTENVRIISAGAQITWAVTQPTQLRIIVTIDGQTLIFYVADPVSGHVYNAYIANFPAPNAGYLVDQSVIDTSLYRAFLLEGRSVKVEAAVIWGVTQPTPLVCRVKWAKR